MKKVLVLSALTLLAACGAMNTNMTGSPMAKNECSKHMQLTPGTTEYNDCVMRMDDNSTMLKKAE